MDDGVGFDCTVSTVLPRFLWVLSSIGDAIERGQRPAARAVSGAGRKAARGTVGFPGEPFDEGLSLGDLDLVFAREGGDVRGGGGGGGASARGVALFIDEETLDAREASGGAFGVASNEFALTLTAVDIGKLCGYGVALEGDGA